MATDFNYDFPSSSDEDINDDTSDELDSDIAQLESTIDPSDGNNAKQRNARNYLAKKKIEQLQEERRLRKLEDDYYDDWD